jgi:hypothetical protein
MHCLGDVFRSDLPGLDYGDPHNPALLVALNGPSKTLRALHGRTGRLPSARRRIDLLDILVDAAAVAS